MKWFQHDANASTDAKIRKLLIKHSAEGYAVYFHCLELIAGNVEKRNITFELEHDTEIIADNLKIKGDSQLSAIDKVNQIMKTIIKLGLFEESNNRIFCMKLAARLDNTISRSPEINTIKKKMGIIETPENQYIYIIKGKDFYKIGKTKNMDRRLKEFRTSIPYEVDIVQLTKVSDMDKAEKDIHNIYKSKHEKGEWFKLSKRDINEIKEHLRNHYSGHTQAVRCTDVAEENRIEEKRREENKKTKLDTSSIDSIFNSIKAFRENQGTFKTMSKGQAINFNKQKKELLRLTGFDPVEFIQNVFNFGFKDPFWSSIELTASHYGKLKAQFQKQNKSKQPIIINTTVQSDDELKAQGFFTG